MMVISSGTEDLICLHQQVYSCRCTGIICTASILGNQIDHLSGLADHLSSIINYLSGRTDHLHIPN